MVRPSWKTLWQFLKKLYIHLPYVPAFSLLNIPEKMKHVHMKTCMWLFIATFGNSPKLEHPLEGKEIKPVNPKGNQPWIFIGRPDAEAESPILWPPEVKSWLIGKDPDAGKDWRQEKGTIEDEMVGWHHWLDGHKFEQTSWRQWRTEEPAVLQSTGLQRAGHDLVTEQ